MEKIVQLLVIPVNKPTIYPMISLRMSYLACYGIVSIPDGDWYCRRCEAGESQAV
jgi:hypothetical protein